MFSISKSFLLKCCIVETFKANGERVTMTSDGVNDAPAFKSVNIGIAMGERSTDIVLIVLLDNDFISIVAGAKTSRRCFDNLKKLVTSSDSAY